MATLEMSRPLPTPADKACGHASDLSALGDWMSMHQGWRSELPDELGVGATVVGVAGAKGMRNRVTWTVRTFDPPSALEVSGEGVGGTHYKLAKSVASTGEGAPSPCAWTSAAPRCSARSALRRCGGARSQGRHRQVDQAVRAALRAVTAPGPCRDVDDGGVRGRYSVAGRITTTDVVRAPESCNRAITRPSGAVAA